MNRRPVSFGLRLALALILALPLAGTASAAEPLGPGTRLVPAAGTTSIHTAVLGSAAVADPELRRRRFGRGDPEGARPRPEVQKGTFPKKELKSPKVKSSAVADANPEVSLSFEGLNHFDQRTANGGNQFSLEPPDQALCVANRYVVEATNGVLRVWSTACAPLTGVQDLNTFFNYPAAIDRTTLVFGPNVIDPVCYFDPENDRFMVAITTLHAEPDGTLTGKNTIDLAVSNTPDPTGLWTIYSVPAQNDGTDGTPNHHCLEGDAISDGPCFQDYPHMGGDRHGVYISTNEYDLFGPGYSGGQIFAFSKAELAAHPAAVAVTLVEDIMVNGSPGFTVWPAISPLGHASNEANGTEYFLSTLAGDGSETGNPTGTATKIAVWALSNTQSLTTGPANLQLSSKVINSQDYTFPPLMTQKPGEAPLRDCLNDNTLFEDIIGPGTGCWFLFFDPPPTWQPEVLTSPDSLDTRMQQTWYVNGLIWGSSGTGVNVEKDIRAGIAWFAVNPKVDKKGNVEGNIKRQGYVALAGHDLTMPAIAMGANGTGAIAFTVVGDNYFPSAGYVMIGANGNTGPIHIAGAGLGPHDGFSGYKAFVDPPRARWGDYGAAVTDGNTIWLASEYIAQTCTYAQYVLDEDADLTCGGTRTAFANWSTHLTKLTP